MSSEHLRILLANGSAPAIGAALRDLEARPEYRNDHRAFLRELEARYGLGAPYVEALIDRAEDAISCADPRGHASAHYWADLTGSRCGPCEAGREQPPLIDKDAIAEAERLRDRERAAVAALDEEITETRRRLELARARIVLRPSEEARADLRDLEDALALGLQDHEVEAGALRHAERRLRDAQSAAQAAEGATR